MTWSGVLFDLDGTLADTVELILRSFRHTMERHLDEIPPESRFLETIGKPLPVQLRDFARSEEERVAMLETYVAFQRAHHDDMVKPFPGALDVVDELRARDVRVGIVTARPPPSRSPRPGPASGSRTCREGSASWATRRTTCARVGMPERERRPSGGDPSTAVSLMRKRRTSSWTGWRTCSGSPRSGTVDRVSRARAKWRSRSALRG